MGTKYVMPQAMVDFLMKQRKGDENKMNRDDYLKKVVNEQFGLRGTCTEISIV